MTTWVWRDALDVLARVLPGSTGLLLDQIDGIPADAWQRFRLDDLEDRDSGGDGPAGERLVAQVGTALGADLIVVTDASWRQDVGPFVTTSWHLVGLIRDHVARTGESFFNGDVVILSPDDGAVVAVHRAGLVAVAHGEPAPRQPVWPLGQLVGSSVFAGWEPALEWTHLVGEIYPDTEVTLPSGRVLAVRWFETDPQVSFVAPTGDFQLSYRGDPDDADAVLSEFLEVAGPAESDLLRLSPMFRVSLRS